jgi:hypothetical protein
MMNLTSLSMRRYEAMISNAARASRLPSAAWMGIAYRLHAAADYAATPGQAHRMLDRVEDAVARGERAALAGR